MFPSFFGWGNLPPNFFECFFGWENLPQNFFQCFFTWRTKCQKIRLKCGFFQKSKIQGFSIFKNFFLFYKIFTSKNGFKKAFFIKFHSKILWNKFRKKFKNLGKPLDKRFFLTIQRSHSCILEQLFVRFRSQKKGCRVISGIKKPWEPPL